MAGQIDIIIIREKSIEQGQPVHKTAELKLCTSYAEYKNTIITLTRNIAS